MQVSIDTACSSAMVGTHTAAQGLLKHGGCALAGGINLMLAESTTAAALTAGMLTADGHCKTLDASADGYVRAETCAVMLLDTTGEGDRNAAVILSGSFVNQVQSLQSF